MIDFQKIKFRASSWGNLMSEPQTKKDKEAGLLSKTCQKELIKIYNQEVYGRKKDITTKQMDKGIQAEEDSITLFSRVEKKLFLKNTEKLENDWATGHVDIYEGEDVRSAISVWDIKSRWELDSFMPKLVEEVDFGEECQVNVYYALTGANSGGIANTLVDCPINILMEEQKRLLWSMNVVSEESPEYLKAAAELQRLLTFPDIDYRERVIKQEVKRDDQLIAAMQAKVPKMRQWLQDFHEKHLNLYKK